MIRKGIVGLLMGTMGFAGCQGIGGLANHGFAEGKAREARGSYGGICRPFAYNDFDRDGDIDMIMTNDSGDVIYLENTGNKENKYERHKIGSVDMGKFGVGVSLVDVDMDGDLDIVAYSEKERKTFRNCMK